MTFINTIILFLLTLNSNDAFTNIQTNIPTKNVQKIKTTSKPLTQLLPHHTCTYSTPTIISSLFMISKSGGGGSTTGNFLDSILSEEYSQFAKYTHMIGIPLEENRDLLLELESVQRAILYNCPFLLNACIVPVVTRMPLLYVDTVMATGGIGGGNRDDVTDTLQQIVKEVIDKHVRVKSISDEDVDSAGMGGVNKDGYQPVMMTFKGLELDGDKCEVLHVIGNNDCDGTKLIRKVLTEIQQKVEERGWKTLLPPDNPQGKKSDKVNEEWRPRVPFMRLPDDFEETLPPLPDGENEYDRLPEDGGNGISPIFWYKWWEDDFTKDDGIRLREIAIYSRSGPWGLSEKAFYLPSMTVKLPDGNEILAQSEAKDKEYSESRLKEQLGEEAATMELELSQEIADAREQYTSELESSIQKRKDISQTPKETRWDEENVQNGASTYYSAPNTSQPRKPGDPIVKTISNRTPIPSQNTEQSLKPSPGKNLQDIDLDNDEGVKRIRNMLKQKPTRAADSRPKVEPVPLPPYPSDEHFVGVWRLVSSPTKNDQLSSILPDSSDNMILRVDGGVAGGPVLNQEDNQKGAGGSWRVFQARWAGGGDMPEMEQTRLRIKLIIPPEKKDLLVMEGEVTRVMIPRTSPSRAFNMGISEDNDDMSNINALGKENDFFIHCDGEVWVQDIEGTGNRRKLGMFSAMKLDTPDQGAIRYTIPSPKSLDSP